jgi:glycosyltransferase involved in cell wall biosynthesis
VRRTPQAVNEPLRVLGLATYPQNAAATRYRLLQFIPKLADEGIALDVHPFLSDRTFSRLYDRRHALGTSMGILAGLLRRFGDAVLISSYDLVIVQREATLVGPPVVEWLAKRSRPLILDLDDATYLERASEVFGTFASALKWRGKTTTLISWARHTVCGNPEIADFIREQGGSWSILPTIVDTDIFRPRETTNGGVPVIGWIGSHSTFPYLKQLQEVFNILATSHRFRVRIVGAGKGTLEVPRAEVEFLPWQLEREVSDLQSFDIAVYPMPSDAWARGKSGFKAVQYLSCGVPYVASPVGVVADLGIAGQTHLEASTTDEWVSTLRRLLDDVRLRKTLGQQGRDYAVKTFSVSRNAQTLAQVFRSVMNA